MKLDSLHFALLVAIVLLAIYAFGSFREEMHIPSDGAPRWMESKGIFAT